MLRMKTIVVLLAVCFAASSAFAENRRSHTQLQTKGDFDDDDDGWGDEADDEPVFPRLEHRGYFRFRADMFHNGHLGIADHTDPQGATLTIGGFKPPLTENKVNHGSTDKESTIGGANMRFRYQPRLLVSDTLEINATFDIMDNLVLGSTPDFNFDRADIPMSAFSTSQAPPGSGQQFQDSVRVKELWGQWKLLGMPIRFGRMSSHWGLGMLANGGNGWDDDFGDYNDRILVALQIYGVYVMGGYDIVSSGPTYKQADQPFGQAYDITDTDDVEQGFFGIFSRPVQDAELEKRRMDLIKHRKWCVDWGIYSVYRKQSMDLAADDIGKDAALYADNMSLMKRGAWAAVGDVWFKLENKPSYKQYLRFEVEAAFIMGEIDDASTVETQGKKNPRKIQSWGVAMESEYTTGGLTLGLNAGAASGDDAEYLGVLDQKNFADSTSAAEVGAAKFNEKITNFKFDRNYHVDNLLFREVIGAVTNAWYAKPYIRYDLFDSPDGAIGARFDALIAMALEKDAYPGNDAYLGTELGLTFFVENENNFYGDLNFSVLLPGGAFKLTEEFSGLSGFTAQDPELAWTLQTHLVMKY